ncbi:hypothetical protein [Achromobacter sp.]|uniref:hypothetical protein n=1 Tax=Achromobacter sp. TaxID=134375 RepID=UPI003C7587FB
MAMSVCADPVRKKPSDRRKNFPLTIALSQAFDLLGFCINRSGQACAKKEQKLAKNAFQPPFFHGFFAFCREATCTPYLVRA